VLTSFLKRIDEWTYHIPFAIQWMWPVPILIGVIFASEPPWWHIRKGHTDKAKHSFHRLTSARAAERARFNVDETIAMMVHTNELEIQNAAGTSYLQCFKGTDLRRTEIVSLVWVIQTF
jgi:MFS transporter, SP family, general alpha glucoside:H+ symporter